MRIIFLLLVTCISSCCCQFNKTIFEALQTFSPVLYTHIQSSAPKELLYLLDQRQYNVTFLLPNEAALNNSLETGLLNFSLPTSYNRLSAMILNGSFTNQMFLSSRQFYPTFLNGSISIGPQIVNNNKTKNIEIYSGMIKAVTSATEIRCINGIIQYIDHFLQPAETPLDTISALSETEYMEGLLKSLNVSDIISGMNRTILVPVNEAWDAINGSTLPFGTLVHNLRYSVIDGIYTLDKILDSIDTTTNSTFLTSDYLRRPIKFQLDNKQLTINDNAKFIKTDILTSHGVIHLLDTVLLADTIENENKTLLPTSGTENSPLDRKSSITSKSCIIENLFLVIVPLIFLLL